MNSRIRFSVGTAVLGIVATVLVLAMPASSPLRAVSAMLLILLLPGVGIARLLTEPANWHFGVERGLMVLLLSLASVVLCSVGLYVFGAPLNAESWTLSQGVVVVVAALVNLAANPRASSGKRSVARVGRLRRTFLVVGVLLPVAGATAVTIPSVRHRDARDHFTQLWAQPADDDRVIAIGVYNHEGMSRRYLLEVTGAKGASEYSALVPPRTTWTTAVARDPKVEVFRAVLRGSVTAAGPQSVELHLPPGPATAAPKSTRRGNHTSHRPDRRRAAQKCGGRPCAARPRGIRGRGRSGR
jgi:hypothetical protein